MAGRVTVGAVTFGTLVLVDDVFSVAPYKMLVGKPAGIEMFWLSVEKGSEAPMPLAMQSAICVQAADRQRFAAMIRPDFPSY